MRKLFILPALLAFCALCAGCPSPNTDAALVTIAGSSMAEIFTEEGNPTSAAQATQLSQTLSQDILNIQAGTSTVQVAVQVGQDLVALVNTIDPGSKDAALAGIALSTILGVIQALNPPQNPVVLAAPQAVTQATVQTVPPALSVSEYKARWNAELKARPVVGLKPL